MSFFMNLWVAFKDILRAPLTVNLWWQLLPVLVLWVAIEIYLDRHKHEELGWNSALGNGISLFWISVSSMQPLFVKNQLSFPWATFFVLLLVLAYSLFIIYISFTHKLRSRLGYELAYPTVIYYLAIFTILWGHRALNMNLYVLIMFVVLFIVVWGVRWVFFWLLPDAPESEEPLTEEHHEEIRGAIAGVAPSSVAPSKGGA